MSQLDSSDIDELAKRTFLASLPPSWIVVPEEPDKRHLDYAVHVREKGQASGLDFFVQVKGIHKPKFGRRGLPYSFDRKHIEYWIERHRRPVFVVVVDVGQRRGYWRDVHEGDRTANSAWRRNSKHATIRIPQTHCLDDVGQLLEAVHAADIAIRERWPSSVQAAAAHATLRLQAIDSRFEYEHRHCGGETMVVAHAKEPVSFSVEPLQELAIEKLPALIDYGQQTSFGPGEVGFKGGGIFDELSKIASERGINVQIAGRAQCEVSMLGAADGGRITPILYGVRGTVVGGPIEKRFEVQLGDRLVAISGSLRIEDGTIHGYHHLTFDAGVWTGQPVLQLQYFDRISRFFKEAAAAESVFLQFEIGAWSASAPLSQDQWRSLIDSVGPRIDFIERARAVAAWLDVNPPLPDLDMLTRDEAEEVGLLWNAIADGSARRSAQGRIISAKVVIDPDSPALEQLRSADLSHLVFAVRRRDPAVLFGVVSARWTLVHDIFNLRIARESQDDLRAAVHSGVSGRVALVPAEHSAIVTRLLPAGDSIDSLAFTK